MGCQQVRVSRTSYGEFSRVATLTSDGLQGSTSRFGLPPEFVETGLMHMQMILPSMRPGTNAASDMCFCFMQAERLKCTRCQLCSQAKHAEFKLLISHVLGTTRSQLQQPGLSTGKLNLVESPSVVQSYQVLQGRHELRPTHARRCSSRTGHLPGFRCRWPRWCRGGCCAVRRLEHRQERECTSASAGGYWWTCRRGSQPFSVPQTTSPCKSLSAMAMAMLAFNYLASRS